MRRIGLALPPAIEEGSLTLTDFCQLVLPHDNTILRATASQRITNTPDMIAIKVEAELARLFKLECEMQGVFEKLKVEMEGLKGFSTKKLFKKIDR